MVLLIQCVVNSFGNVFLWFVLSGGNQDGKFSVGFRDGIVRTVVGLDRETQAAYTLVVEAIGKLTCICYNRVISHLFCLLSSKLLLSTCV